MGSGASYAKSSFDPPTTGKTYGSITTRWISPSHLYCLAQHNAEWPEYYCMVDCRSQSAYDKAHIIGSKHVSELGSLADQTSGVTVVIYDKKDKSPTTDDLLTRISAAGANPTAVYVLQGPFSKFKKNYRVIMSNFTKTVGEQPGPVELIPVSKKNPAVYCIHRNQFQHCKTTIAYLGCSTVINISSRRLFLKTAAIKLENIQFDSVNEPYDEAITSLAKYINTKPKSPLKGNILTRCLELVNPINLDWTDSTSSYTANLIDETGFDYGSLLVGWYWFQKGNNLEQICEHLSNKFGELDPWYLDVLRAWAETPEG